MTEKLPTWKLTVRLAKDGMTVEDCVDAEKVKSAKLIEEDWPTIPGSKIYSGRAYAGAPKWKDFFGKTASFGDIDNRGAVCFIALPSDDRLLFISFGPAQIYLKSEAFERDFGLKVTLNSVAESELVSVDAKTAED